MGLLSIANFVANDCDGLILVVGEDATARHNIVTFLSDHNLMAKAVSRRHDLLLALSRNEPELIILNLDMARDGGLDLVREIRSRSAVPLFILAGENRDDIDRIIGLELGADEYMSQPFSLRELLARVRSSFRRRTLDRISPARRNDRRYAFAGWLFDERAHQLRSPIGTLVPLTKSEFNLLGAFLSAPRRALTREHLLQATHVHEDAYDRSIDVQVLRLRRKMEQDKQRPKLIRTERGIGYVLDADVQLLLPGDAMTAPPAEIGQAPVTRP